MSCQGCDGIEARAYVSIPSFLQQRLDNGIAWYYIIRSLLQKQKQAWDGRADVRSPKEEQYVLRRKCIHVPFQVW